MGEQNASDQANFLLKTICNAAPLRAGMAISACDLLDHPLSRMIPFVNGRRPLLRRGRMHDGRRRLVFGSMPARPLLALAT